MPKITIELELGPGFEQGEDGEFYPVEREAFDEQILAAVVERFANSLNYDGRKRLDKAVTERADKIIEERLNAEIERVLAGPLQRYDYMGDPKGDPFTINELIVEAVQKFATAPAGRTDSYGRREGAGNLADLINDAVREALGKELAGDVAEIRKSVAAEIKSRLTGATADAIANPRR